GWHVERGEFEAMMLDAAASRGAQVCRGARLENIERDAKNWRVTVQRGSSKIKVEGRFLIDASGRSAVLARRLGIRRICFDDLICVLKFGTGCATNNRIAIESAPDGWWYGSQLPNQRVLAAYMTDVDLFDRRRSGLDMRWTRRLRTVPGMHDWLQGA